MAFEAGEPPVPSGVDDARQPRSPGPAIALISATIFAWLAAPDVGFRDSGELGAASFVLGVPHPTGFPLDMLLLRLGAMLPLGAIAWRQNLVVALLAAAVLGLLGDLTFELYRRSGMTPARGAYAGAALAAVGLGAWETFLYTALQVEVYTTALFLIALAGHGAMRGGRRAGLVFVVAGLSVGAHVSVGLITAPILIAAILARSPGRRLRFLLPRVAPVLVCTLIVAYLPLASLRRPPVDWGSPRTLSALFDHLTAERIRSAYQGEMWGGGQTAILNLVNQLAEQWMLFPLALTGAAVALRKARSQGLLLLGLLAMDLAYCAWVNPMGIRDRQVGHLTGAIVALFSGVGAAALVFWLWPRPWTRVIGLGLAPAVSMALLINAPWGELADGHAATELFGSGGPYCRLPPRSTLLCRSDSACAGAMFASYVEAERPDMIAAPSQHLWDAAILSKLEGFPPVRALIPATPAPAGTRLALARAVIKQLVVGGYPRPLFWESAEPLRDAGYLGPISVSRFVPFLQASRKFLPLDEPADPVAELDYLRSKRLPGGRSTSSLVRYAWSLAYGNIGQGLLEAGNPARAVAAMRRAAEIAPFRPEAWTNLGVALYRSGDLTGADRALLTAVRLDVLRPTPWFNLASFAAAQGQPRLACRILDLARQSRVEDAHLDELRRQLGSACANPEKP